MQTVQMAGTTRQKLYIYSHVVGLETQINQLQVCNKGALTSR